MTIDPHPPTVEQRETLDAIRGVLQAAEDYREALVAHLGLGRTEGQAISQISSTEGLGQTELSTRLGITTGSTTALADRLEAAGLVRRTSHPTDRRRAVLVLTEAGVGLVRKGQESLDRLFAGLEDHNLTQLTAALKILDRNLRREIRRL